MNMYINTHTHTHAHTHTHSKIITVTLSHRHTYTCTDTDTDTDTYFQTPTHIHLVTTTNKFVQIQVVWDMYGTNTEANFKRIVAMGPARKCIITVLTLTQLLGYKLLSSVFV